MRELTSFDHYALTWEMKDLKGSYFQKISKIDGGYKLKFRKGSVLLIFPDKVYFTSYSVGSLEPDRIALKVRKELSGFRLLDVYTLNLDRVVVFDFGSKRLIAELFRKGNLILVDQDGTIVDLLEEGSWRDRTLKRGVMYNTPPAPPISREEVLMESFLIRDLIRSGIPKPYAIEVINRLGYEEKTPTSVVSREEILQTVKELLDELRQPGGFLCDGEPYPISMSYLSCEKRFDRFSEALDTFTPTLFDKKEREKDRKEKTKLDYMLESLESINKEIGYLEALLNEIYEHWSELESMMKTGIFHDAGKLRFRKKDGKFVFFDFTP